MLMKVLFCILCSSENLIGLFSGDEPDVPRTSFRKPTQPEKLGALDF
jgi:hypothetical protein